MTDLHTLGPGYTDSVGQAINDSGQVTGVVMAGGKKHAFLYSNGVMTDLGTLGGNYSTGTAINASGQVVGSAYTAGSALHAFLYSGGQMLDLNNLVDPSTPLGLYWVLTEGIAITDTGYILANGVNTQTGHTHAFLLFAPVPLPAAAWLLLSGLAGLGIIRRRRTAA